MINFFALGAGLCFSGLTTFFWGVLTDNEGSVLLGLFSLVIGVPLFIWGIADKMGLVETVRRRMGRGERPPGETPGDAEEGPEDGEDPAGEGAEGGEGEEGTPEEGETPPEGEEEPTPEEPEEEIPDPDIHVITVEPQSEGILHKVYEGEVVELRASAKNRFIEGGFFEFHTVDDKVIEKIKIHNKGKLVKERVKIPGRVGTTIKIHVKLRLKGEKKHTEGLPGITVRHKERDKKLKDMKIKIKKAKQKKLFKPKKVKKTKKGDRRDMHPDI